MAGWTHQDGIAVALPLDNVDTDQLIPARFMSQPRHAGYAAFLLHDVRRNTEGQIDPDFPLNKVPDASVLVAGRNFGCGSSREAAVYALVDAGFRVVAAPSFGDIFAANAVNNGFLPARISDAGCAQLAAHAGQSVHVDLTASDIRIGETCVPFELDEAWRQKLINGWDDIDLTCQHAGDIEAFTQNLNREAPWASPRKREIVP